MCAVSIWHKSFQEQSQSDKKSKGKVRSNIIPVPVASRVADKAETHFLVDDQARFSLEQSKQKWEEQRSDRSTEESVIDC